MEATSLCLTCKAIDIAGYFRHATDVAYSHGFFGATPTALNLGHLEDIYGRKDTCSFCRLIVASIQKRRPKEWKNHINVKRRIQEEEDKDSKTQLYMYSYMFANNTGRNPNFGPQNNWPISLDAYRIGIALRIQDSNPSFLDHVGDIQLSASSAVKLGKNPLFHGRRINPSQLDFGLPKWWLKVCQTHHESACEFHTVENNTVPEDLLVIDVEALCISSLPPCEAYFALSYCWPAGETFVLNKSNFADLREQGSLRKHMDKLPKTIHDAIQFMQIINKRYLWVDALCIVQDDGEKKMLQISQMDRVYSWATLTLICAPDFKQDSGFPLCNVGSRSYHQVVETVQGLELMVPLIDLGSYLMQSRWDTRAWTFQERKLSKRRLYFTPTQLYFECFNALFCEDTVAEGISSASFCTPGSNLWSDVDNGKTRKMGYGQVHLSRTPYEDPLSGLKAYKLLLEDYSNRQMTNPADILNAFTGIITVLQRSMRCQFICGLPERWIDNSLLWVDTGPQIRRFTSEGMRETPLFPSWSWAGWLRDSTIDLSVFNHLIHPEIIWYAVTENGSLVHLDTAYVDGIMDQLERLQVVKPTEMPPSSFLQRIRPREQKFVSSQQWSNLRRLACWTNICQFHLSGDVYTNRILHLGGGFASNVVLVISDDTGSAVGSIMMGLRWKHENLAQPRTFEFILLSRSREKSPITEFDTVRFKERQWAYVNVMLIYRNDGIATRVGVGVVHEDAWVNARPTSTVITLE